jgi:hypothetical protein
MIHDEELDFARERVMELFQPGMSLSPLEVISRLKSDRLPEGLVRSANLSLVNAGRLEITPSFKLRLPTPDLVAAG